MTQHQRSAAGPTPHAARAASHLHKAFQLRSGPRVAGAECGVQRAQRGQLLAQLAQHLHTCRSAGLQERMGMEGGASAATSAGRGLAQRPARRVEGWPGQEHSQHPAHSTLSRMSAAQMVSSMPVVALRDERAGPRAKLRAVSQQRPVHTQPVPVTEASAASEPRTSSQSKCMCSHCAAKRQRFRGRRQGGGGGRLLAYSSDARRVAPRPRTLLPRQAPGRGGAAGG